MLLEFDLLAGRGCLLHYLLKGDTSKNLSWNLKSKSLLQSTFSLNVESKTCNKANETSKVLQEVLQTMFEWLHFDDVTLVKMCIQPLI